MLWLRPSQQAAAERLLDGLDVSLVAVGSPHDVSAKSSVLLEHETSDDIRRTVAAHPEACLILLAVTSDVREAFLKPASFPRPALSATAPIIAVEPLMASLTDMRRVIDEHPAWISRLHHAPQLLRSHGGVTALESVESFGRIRSIDLAMRTGGELSLGAMLLDAMEFVAATLGEPESIDASMSGVEAHSGLRLAAGEALTSISGDLNAHLRFPDDRAAVISLSDRAGAWFRGATMLGVGGCLRFDDASFEWIDSTGQVVEKTAEAQRAEATFESLLAEQIRSIMAAPHIRTSPDHGVRAFALAEAALLSARTGQPESPTTILRMAGIS